MVGMDARMTKLMFALLVALAASAGIHESIQAEPLTVGAPPSLRAAFREIVPMFEQEHHVPVNIVYTPSKMLLRQIEQGTPIDVFVSAGVEEVAYLHKKGLTLNGEPRILAQTALVLVMSADSPATFVSLPEALASHSTRIALGDPEMSYLGEVTARALSKLYPAYRGRTRILYAAHTEDILNLIHTGKADVGLVYRANVINSGEVRISDEIPLGAELQVQFGQAVVSTCRASLRSAAEQFSDFLITSRVLRLLEKYGFDTAVPPAKRTAGPVSSMPSESR
jgi:molybdate transport system substrate-binding protein